MMVASGVNIRENPTLKATLHSKGLVYCTVFRHTFFRPPTIAWKRVSLENAAPILPHSGEFATL